MAQRARVLLAEDHPAVANQLRDLLSVDFEVLARVSDGFALLGAAEALHPDAIVSDIVMPGLDGIDAITRIRAKFPNIAVVFISVHADKALIERALKVGALGYVLKGRAGEELVGAVHASLRGERHLSPQLAQDSSA